MKNDTFNASHDDSDHEVLSERAASIRFMMEGILLPSISTFGFIGEKLNVEKAFELIL